MIAFKLDKGTLKGPACRPDESPFVSRTILVCLLVILMLYPVSRYC